MLRQAKVVVRQLTAAALLGAAWIAVPVAAAPEVTRLTPPSQDGPGDRRDSRDVFNVFNTVNLGLPDANIANTATVGQIRSLSGDPRIMQFSARFRF